MSGKDDSLGDLPLIRDAFTKCIKDLVEKTDFDIMYEELINTVIGKERMSCVFVLRADLRGDNDKHLLQGKSQELYNRIDKENDKEFVQWFDAIRHALSRTGNTKNGKHQEVWEKISKILEDSKNMFKMSCQVSHHTSYFVC